jgi:hypothetical protein
MSQPKPSEGFGSKVLLALISAVLGFGGGYLLHVATKTEAELTITVAQGRVEFGKNRVVQIVSIRNGGNDLAKSIRLAVKGFEGRLMEQELGVSWDPPRLDVCQHFYAPNGDFTLMIGDLQPGATSTIRLVYKRPELTVNDLELFADNARARKSTVPTFGELY